MYHVHVYRLYKSLGDFDSLCGIFSSQIGTKAVTSDALEAEERGDYIRALQLYKEVCLAIRSSECVQHAVYLQVIEENLIK